MVELNPAVSPVVVKYVEGAVVSAFIMLELYAVDSDESMLFLVADSSSEETVFISVVGGPTDVSADVSNFEGSKCVEVSNDGVALSSATEELMF